MPKFKLLSNHEGAVIAKLQEHQAQSLEESEQDRCFEHCAGTVCKRILKPMIERGLTIYHVVMDEFIDTAV